MKKRAYKKNALLLFPLLFKNRFVVSNIFHANKIRKIFINIEKLVNAMGDLLKKIGMEKLVNTMRGLFKYIKKIIIISILIALIFLHGLESTVQFKIDAITMFLLILIMIILFPEFVSKISEIAIPGVGVIKFLREKVDRLEAFKEGEKITSDEWAKRVTELEKKVPEAIKTGEREKSVAVSNFKSLASDFTIGVQSRTLTLRDRTRIVRNLQIEGSKITDSEFLINKLKEGNLGEMVGAAATLKIIRNKSSLSPLLDKLNYVKPRSSFVRYRVVETIFSLITSRFFEQSELENIKSKLIERRAIEKNPWVKESIDKSLIEIDKLI